MLCYVYQKDKKMTSYRQKKKGQTIACPFFRANKVFNKLILLELQLVLRQELGL
jgi:hypothetical protein